VNKTFLKIKSANAAFSEAQRCQCEVLEAQRCEREVPKARQHCAEREQARRADVRTPSRRGARASSAARQAWGPAAPDTTLLQSAGGIIVVAVTGSGSSFDDHQPQQRNPARRADKLNEEDIPAGGGPGTNIVKTSSVDCRRTARRTIPCSERSPEEIYQVHVQIFPTPTQE